MTESLQAAPQCQSASPSPSLSLASLPVSSYAYVTMVTSDDFVIGAQVLSYSLRRQGCSFPLLCLVTPNVSFSSLRLLSASGLHPVLVPPRGPQWG
jgi:hypothetical protein